MVRLLGSKVGNISYLDLLGAGAVKYVTENLLAGYIGNGTIMSGAIKLGISMVAGKFLGKGLLGDSVRLGIGIDGVEDILINILGGLGGLGGGENW